MKKLIYIVPIVLVALFLMFNQTTSAKDNDKQKGIQFTEGTWKEIAAKAEKENKLIFLDIYATWCGPCKLLKKRTFPNEELGAYFNKHFINVTMDGEKGDGAMLAAKYQIPGYPSLLILDKDGNVISNTAGYMPPKRLLDFGKSAQDAYDKAK